VSLGLLCTLNLRMKRLTTYFVLMFRYNRTFEHIIKTEDFLKTSKHNLLQFLSDDEIRGTEMEIFEACLRLDFMDCVDFKNDVLWK